MKKLLLSLFTIMLAISYAKADAYYLAPQPVVVTTESVQKPKLSWDLPLGIGNVQLPFQTSELVAGQDFILHDQIAGYSTPVLNLWKEIVGEAGMVGVLKAQAVEPYLAIGVDCKKHLPDEIAYYLKDLHLNAFGRWDTARGKPGAGLSASYSF